MFKTPPKTTRIAVLVTLAPIPKEPPAFATAELQSRKKTPTYSVKGVRQGLADPARVAKMLRTLAFKIEKEAGLHDAAIKETVRRVLSDRTSM